MALDDNYGVCYVCFESGAPKASCGCITAHVHDECMMESLRYTKKAHCTVCLQPYKNVSVKVHVRRSCNTPYLYSLVFFTFSMTIAVCCIVIVLSSPSSVAYIAAGAFYGISFGTWILAFHLLVRSRQQRLPLLAKHQTVTVALKGTPSVELNVITPCNLE